MFNKIYKLLKSPITPTHIKKNYKIFLLKDMKQYKFEYIGVINYITGKNWPLGDKKISFNNLKLIKIFKFLFTLIFYYNLYFIIVY